MDYLIFSTLAYSGLRINELLALKWTDINVHECSLRVTKQIYNPNNKITGYQLETPKTTGSIRTIKIDEKIIDLLKKHRIHQNKIKLKNHMIYQDHGFIFARNDGHPLLRKVVVRRLERLLKKANIDKPITLHGFRHTHCSLLIEARVNMRVIQERLGHESISTTEKIYSHLTASLEKEASQKFSELMNNLLK
jgi:integrase